MYKDAKDIFELIPDIYREMEQAAREIAKKELPLMEETDKEFIEAVRRHRLTQVDLAGQLFRSYAESPTKD